MNPRQTPLKDSTKIFKKPPVRPPPPPQHRPVSIYTITPPDIVQVDEADYAAIVQNLTGKTPLSSPSPPTVVESPGGSLSPASRFAVMENANRPIQRPTPAGILSPGPTSPPPEFFNDLFFPVQTNLPPQDGYWDHHQPPISSFSYGGPPKRPRFDLGHDMRSYSPWDEDLGIPHPMMDNTTIVSDYDFYLHNAQLPSMPYEEVGLFDCVVDGRPGGNNMVPVLAMGEVMDGHGGILPPDFGPTGGAMGFGQQDFVQEPISLPADASNTLYVEGLPSNCSSREVAHIFRPFLGYKQVRLVNTNSKQRNGEPTVLCFVDFENPSYAATARSALQGYRMDEYDPDSNILRLWFS